MTKYIMGFLVILFVTGCSSTYTSKSYERGAVRSEQNVRYGVVESVSLAQIEGSRTGVGAVAGGVVGGVVGSTIGGGRGKVIAAVLGAVAGGVGGDYIENTVTQKNGVEIIVRLDNGGTIAVVQEDDVVVVGDRVKVISGVGGVRVTR